MHPAEAAIRQIGRRFLGGFRTRQDRRGRSKYMPHIGAKERARHAGKPDGPMHVTGHQRRAEHAAWLDTL